MNAKKCKIMVSNGWEDDAVSVIAKGTNAELVGDFCYLSSNNSRPGNCNKESKTRIGKTPNVFGRLVNILKCKRISLPVKIDL